MPWWAILYIIVFTILLIGGIFDDIQKQNKPWYVAGNILTGIFVIVFVVAFYNKNLAEFIDWIIIPMLITGIIWEFYSSTKEISEFAQDTELSNIEKKWISYFSLIIVDLLTIPGYIAGFISCMVII